jgi:protein disulfide-isomerase A6
MLLGSCQLNRCGHCKKLAPVYDQVAEHFKPYDDVVIAKVDVDQYKEYGRKYGIKGFPTMKWFNKGGTVPEDYSGGRKVEDFHDYIYKKTGTSILKRD